MVPKFMGYYYSNTSPNVTWEFLRNAFISSEVFSCEGSWAALGNVLISLSET